MQRGRVGEGGQYTRPSGCSGPIPPLEECVSRTEEEEEYLSFLTNGSQAHTTLVLFIVLRKWTGRPETKPLTHFFFHAPRGRWGGSKKEQGQKKKTALSKNMPKSELAESKTLTWRDNRRVERQIQGFLNCTTFQLTELGYNKEVVMSDLP